MITKTTTQVFHVVLQETDPNKWEPVDWPSMGLKEVQLSRLHTGRYTYGVDCFVHLDQAKEMVFEMIMMEEHINKRFRIVHVKRETKVVSEIVDEKLTVLGTMSRT